jgi:hypothetical protein
VNCTLEKGEAMGDSQKPNKIKSGPLREQIEKQPTKRTCSIDLRIHNPAVVGYSGVDGIDPARALVSLARVKGIDILAISDLYATDFIDKVQASHTSNDIVVIPGVDLRCRIGNCDDVIFSCLFPEGSDSLFLGEFLRAAGVPRSAIGSEKFIVEKPIDQIISLTEERQGIILPVRVDKTPLRAQAIPELVERWGFRVFDLAYAESAQYFSNRWPQDSFHLFTFSNAFALAQVGTRSVRVKLSSPDFGGIRQLLARRDERIHDELENVQRSEKESIRD